MANTPNDNKLKKYIHIGIHYHANNYYRKKNSYLARAILTDFQDFDPINFSIDSYFVLTNIQMIDKKNLEEYFDNEQLIQAVKELSEKEKNFLFEKFIVGKSDTVIAKEKNLSQQAISIYKKRLLKKLKVLMKR